MPSFKSAFVVFSLAVALGVAVFGFHSLRTLLRAFDSPDWPQVLGSVRSSEVKRGCGRQRNSYEVAVRYDYSVHGLEYHGTRVDFGRGYLTGKPRVFHRYPKWEKWPAAGVPVLEKQ